MGTASAAIGNLPTTFAISDQDLLKLQVEMLIYINELRLANGIDAVALNGNLNQAALL